MAQSCPPLVPESISVYRAPSQLTDLSEETWMLDSLPDEVDEICKIVRNATIHHNLLSYYGLSSTDRPKMATVQPPKAVEILRALRNSEPFDLYHERLPLQRVLGACFMESHLLASLLRHRGYPVRVRAGYFRDVQRNPDHIARFWERAFLARRVDEDLLSKEPEEWRRNVKGFAEKQVRDNHHIEHWICEYWDNDRAEWRFLDANNIFLKALSNIDVPFHLPERYFQFASDAWNGMRENPEFNEDRYAEPPVDGRSHIQSQLLRDFLSLLNHDANPDLVETKSYSDVSHDALEELDKLAVILSGDPTREDLVEFYRSAKTIRFRSVEEDRYSFVRNT